MENDIVQTNINYNYDILQRDISKLKEKYYFLKTGNIGESVLKKTIPYIQLGKGKKEVCYSASFHANEWITSVVLMKFLENFCKAFDENGEIYGYPAKDIFDKATIYIIPMVNPDGVDLVTGNVPPNTSIYKKYQNIARNFPAIPFPDGWKANFNGESLINFHLYCQRQQGSGVPNL